jgi:hypothetical protein
MTRYGIQCRITTAILAMTIIVLLFTSSTRGFQIATYKNPMIDLGNNGRLMGITTERFSTNTDYDSEHNHSDKNDRRVVLRRIGYSLFTFLVQPSETVNAFANKISSKYDDRPKRRGPQV